MDLFKNIKSYDINNPNFIKNVMEDIKKEYPRFNGESKYDYNNMIYWLTNEKIDEIVEKSNIKRG